MPNIPGFANLMVLLYTPKAELRIDAELHDYVGAKCGLGYRFLSNKPYDAENDIDLIFDFEISRNDIINVSFSLLPF